MRLENFILNYCHLTREQLSVLFRAIQESTHSKLRTLNVRFNNLSLVAPDILVDALARLEMVDLYSTNLTTVQLTEIYRLVAERRSRTLRVMDIRHNNISSVPASLRSKARENQGVEILLRLDITLPTSRY